MFRHDNISHNHEAVAPARLFQHAEEAVAPACGAQKWPAAVTRTGDKVQVMSAVVAMEAARHDEPYATSSIAAHPCKKRKDGAPSFHFGKKESRAWRRVGHPPGNKHRGLGGLVA